MYVHYTNSFLWESVMEFDRITAENVEVILDACKELVERGELQLAKKALEKVKQFALREGNRHLEVAVWNTLSSVVVSEFELGTVSIEEARHKVEIGIQKALVLEDPDLISFSYIILAQLFTVDDQLGEAMTFLQKSLNIATEAEMPERVVECLSTIGTIYLYWGKYAESASQLEEALKLARIHDMSVRTAYVLQSLSVVYGEQGRWEEALTICHELQANDKDVLGLVYALRSEAEVLYLWATQQPDSESSARLKKAIQCVERAYDICNKELLGEEWQACMLLDFAIRTALDQLEDSG